MDVEKIAIALVDAEKIALTEKHVMVARVLALVVITVIDGQLTVNAVTPIHLEKEKEVLGTGTKEVGGGESSSALHPYEEELPIVFDS